MTERQGELNGLRVYRRLLGYALHYWRAMLVAVLGMMIYAATDTGFAALMKPMLDGSFVERDPQVIKWVPLALIAILLIRGVGGFLGTYYLSSVGRRVIKEIRREMFDQLLYMPVSYYDRTSSGQLISKLTYNVEQVANAATKGLTILIRDTLTVLGLLAWLFYLNWMLTLGLLMASPLVAGFVSYISKTFRRLSHKIQDSMGDITHVAEEMIEGQRIVKIFGGQEYEAKQFEKANEKVRHMNMRWVATRAVSDPIIQFILGLALAGITFLATRESVLEQITVGTFVSFMVALVMLFPPAKNLTNLNAILQQCIAAGQSIFDILDSEREPDPHQGVTSPVTGKIEFRNVHFSYRTGKGEVLNGISFTVQPGETIALVGRSGGGKTTLVNLLPRFYEPTGGQILVDGVDARAYGLYELRRQITYVGQDIVLFNDTIANNIAYGQQGSASREQITEVARAAHALEFIDQLPRGLDTIVGENGVLLSGGQRQRVAIARALLKDAPILILDEATSSLDTEAERHIQAALEVLVANRTTLVIAHRLSTVENAERILVLEDGKIVETGKHAELLALDGTYATLYRLQLSEAGPIDHDQLDEASLLGNPRRVSN